MGNLLRRYWHPIAGSVELDQEPTRAVRLLCEDLVLYKDRSGALGLIGQACAHRRVNLIYGIPEQHGLRCPYHGWLYNEQGQCLEQPAEAPDSTFKERIKLPAYPVQELGGLIWAYLGPEPAPLLPRWDLFVADNVLRDIGHTVLPCNWVQMMENSMDPVHLEWLHGRYHMYALEKQGKDPAFARPFFKKHIKLGFDRFEHGIVKRRVVEGHTEEDEDWRVGHPVLFPNVLRQGSNGRHTFQYRVPMDDTHTWHVWYTCYFPGPGAEVPKQEGIPLHEVPLYDKEGKLITDTIPNQDYMVWMTQGPIADRTKERLAESDKGVILYRRLLKEQMAIVEDGGEPMNVFRDPVKNARIGLPQEELTYTGPGPGGSAILGGRQRYSPAANEIEKVLASRRVV
jgi:5,5'-dehydrodivanillate O-demethylase